jgi:predicted dehydrogenase
VGVVLQYAPEPVRPHITSQASTVAVPAPAGVRLGVIGAGNYAQGVLLPLFKRHKEVSLATVCTATGVKAAKAREKFGFAAATADWREVVADPRINAVLIATRHDLHAEIAAAALRAGKTVWCEKPLCLDETQLADLESAGSQRLVVGFNRRFAAWAAQARAVPGPKLMRYRVSVAPLPAHHWVNDPRVGGGRLLGELCHFVDLLQFAAQARPVRVFAQGFGTNNAQVALRFADGSVGSIDYFEVAGPELAKEQLELFGGGAHELLSDLRDKGQAEMVRQFVGALTTGGPLPIRWGELMASTRASLAVIESLQTGQAIAL